MCEQPGGGVNRGVARECGFGMKCVDTCACAKDPLSFMKADCIPRVCACVSFNMQHCYITTGVGMGLHGLGV